MTSDTMEREAFTRFPSSIEDRLALQALGFIRVDGLTPTCWADLNPKTIAASSRELGHYGQNNGISVITTRGGEIWIARHTDAFVRANRKDLTPLVARLCPNGGGAYVPCSNGEEIAVHDLLSRASDPDYVPR